MWRVLADEAGGLATLVNSRRNPKGKQQNGGGQGSGAFTFRKKRLFLWNGGAVSIVSILSSITAIGVHTGLAITSTNTVPPTHGKKVRDC